MSGRYLFSLLLLAFLLTMISSCPTNEPGQPAAKAVLHGSQTNILNAGDPVPVEVVQKVPALIKELKPGMTRNQVLRHLGLGEYPISFDGGGPASGYWENYHLRTGYNLVLVFDLSQGKNGTFVKAELAGKSWHVETAP